MDDETLTKSQIRRIFSKKRANLSSNTITTHSELILEHLQANFDFSAPVISYVSSSGRNEVSTVHIHKWLLSLGTSLYVPAASFSSVKLAKISPSTLYSKGDYGINVPDSNDLLTPDMLSASIVLVPTLVFDDYGNRLGYGRGYFDRLLATQPNSKKVGLAFSLSRYVGELPSEKTDIKLDAVVTDDKSIVF